MKTIKHILNYILLAIMLAGLVITALFVRALITGIALTEPDQTFMIIAIMLEIHAYIVLFIGALAGWRLFINIKKDIDTMK